MKHKVDFYDTQDLPHFTTRWRMDRETFIQIHLKEQK